MESLGGLGRIWTEVAGETYQHQYYPLTSTAFWVQHRLWGERPLGYHLVNVLLHAANAVVLWQLLRRLGIAGAWLAAAVFAVHPVHVQSVAWVAELKNVQSAFFFLLSMLVFVRWFGLDRAGSPPSSEAGGWKTYGWGFLLFLCALLSKTATCLLPAALLLVLWWKRERVRRRDLLALAPLAAVGTALVLVTVYLETHHGGARGEVFSQSWLERTLIAGRALWFYAGKLAWPVELAFFYPRWEVDAGRWWQYLYPVASVAVMAGLWVARHRIGKGPVAAVGFFVIAAAPISFVNVAFARFSYVADHWQYWASMGLIALAVGAVASREAWRREGTWLRWWGCGTAVVILGGLSLLTWQRAERYENPRTLWYHTLARNPDAWAAHNNLAVALSAQGRHGPAMAHFREALRLQPDLADAHCNLGIILQLQGRLEEAIEHLEAATRARPGMSEAHYNLGNTLYQAGRPDEALAELRTALAIDPNDAEAYTSLGAVLMSLGKTRAGIESYRTALRLDPDHAGAARNLNLALVIRDR